MKFETALLIIYLIFLLVIATGWILNLNKLLDCDFEAPYKCELIHGAGLVPPIGAVTGWLNIEE